MPTPLPVETLPAEQDVDLVLSKQRPDSSIHLLYNGGKGEVFVQNIMMKVTLSNGQVIQQYMNDGNRKPRRGDELVIEGTRGTDLCRSTSPVPAGPTRSKKNHWYCRTCNFFSL